MRTAEQWADDIAARLAARLPVTKAYGGGAQRRALAKQLRPACRQLVALEEELASQSQRITDLMTRDWQAEGPAAAFRAARAVPMQADDYELRLTRREGHQ